MENPTFFHYKTQKTFLHSLSPALKIFLILFLALAAFYLPVKLCLISYPLLILFSAFVLHFRPQEIFSDAKPTLAYIILLYLAGILLNSINYFQNSQEGIGSAALILNFLAFVLRPNFTYFPLLVHLALSLEITSIFYRTTSTAQFKDGFSAIETFITRKDVTPVSDSLALTISFIPKISTFWYRLNRAWLSRDGANSLKKAILLFPKLFHLSMREGYEKSLAIQNRSL